MIKKRIAAFAVTLTMVVGMAMPAKAEGIAVGRFALPEFDVPCRSAILIEQESGTILYDKQADMQVPIASITKVMTMLLTMEALEQGRISLTDLVPVSEHAYNMGGSQIWLEPGEEFTLDEMLKAVCVSSANDAAVAVAEFVGGSEPAFVEMMNQKAQELGMTNTTFKNACGLDEEGHLSSAHDVAIMSREMLTKHPQILEYTGIWMDTLRNGQTQLLNTNKLLKRYDGITGLKTGTTSKAGVCLSASATRNGVSLIAVVLGSPSSGERFDSATTLLDYGFANFENAAATLPADAPQMIAVTGGSQEQVALEYTAPQNILMKKGEQEQLTTSIEVADSVAAPVEAGTQVGTVTVKMGEEVLGEWPITAADSVPKMSIKLGLANLFEALLQY